MVHTPIDFIISDALLGSILPLCLVWIANQVAQLHVLRLINISPCLSHFPAWPACMVAILWSANHAIRLARLHFSKVFEEHATAELLNTNNLHTALIGSFVLALAPSIFALFGAFAYAAVLASPPYCWPVGSFAEESGERALPAKAS